VLRKPATRKRIAAVGTINSFVDLPSAATWRHIDARTGLEVAWFAPDRDGLTIKGTTSAVQDEASWTVDYYIRVDRAWTTSWARIRTRTAADEWTTDLTSTGHGRWNVDGRPAPHLEGCFDVDLEASAMTNALPIHRINPEVDQVVEAPAVYVRVASASVDRLEQRYTRRAGGDGRHLYDYEAPAFEFACQIAYDEHGLVLHYPGIATRMPVAKASVKAFQEKREPRVTGRP
jgi:hypothetical protein